MRELKFRAWSLIGSRMSVGALLKDWLYLKLNPDLQSVENMVFMQYTGLKDKNGKEIYEGDLFRCMYHRDGHTDHIYEVIWNEFSAGFEFQRHGNPCPQYQVRQEVRDHAGWKGEIIGNIYGNPELLK